MNSATSNEPVTVRWVVPTGRKAMNSASLMAGIILLLVFGFTSILGMLLTTEIIDGFNETGHYSSVAQEAGDGFIFTHTLFDYSIVLVMVAVIVGIGVTSYKIAAPGFFFVVMLFTGAFYGLIAFFFNYLFQELVSDPLFTSVLVHFPRTVLICKNLHWVMLLEIIVGSITLWGKKPEGQFLS